MIASLLILHFLLPQTSEEIMARKALEKRFGKPVNVHINECLQSPLLKNHFIVFWENITDDEALVIDRGIYQQVAGIAFDTPAYILSGRHRQREFNDMIAHEDIKIERPDQAVDLGKLYIKIVFGTISLNGMEWDSPLLQEWVFADELDDSVSYVRDLSHLSFELRYQIITTTYDKMGKNFSV